MSNSPELINSMFLAGLSNEEHRKEAEAVFGGFIRDRLQESAFSRKVLKVEPKSNNEFGIQRSTTHDGLVWMGEVEPESGAAAMTFTTMPTVQYLKSKRYEVPFFQIGSRNYQTTEQELLASTTPIHKVVEAKTVNDMSTIEDLRFLTLCEAAVAETSQVLKGTGTGAGAASADIEQDDIIGLKNILSEKRRPASKLLVSQTDFNKLLKWAADDVGFNSRERIVYGKWVPNNLFDVDIVTTIKTDLLKQGNAWLFATPEYLGKFLTLGTTNFFLKKERDIISFSSWNYIGLSLVNLWSIAKLELYSGATQALPAQETLFDSDIAVPPVPKPSIIRA